MDVRPLRHKPTSRKTRGVLIVFWLFLGWTGAHRMYVGHVALGLFYLALWFFTCGLGGVFGYIDGLILLLGQPKDEQGLPIVWGHKRGKLLIDPLEEGTFEIRESIARIIFHFGVLFALPYVVASASLALFET